MKSTLKCALFLIRETVKRDKKLLLLDILVGLMREAQNMVAIFLPATIVSLIISPQGTNTALIVVTAINLVMVFIASLLEHLEQDLSVRAVKVVNYLTLGLNRKVMRVNFIEIERSDSMEKYYKASDGLWNTDDLHFMVFSVIFSKSVTLVLTFMVFTRVHVLVAVVVFLTILIEYLLSVRFSKKQHEYDQSGSVYNHQRRYVDDTLFDQQALRDMVFNDAKSFLLQKRVKLTDVIIGVTKNKHNIVFTESVVSAFLGLIRTIAVYIIAMMQYSAEKVALSDFLMFTSAAQQMTYALFQITYAASYIHRASIYYNDYLQYIELPETDRLEGSVQTPESVHIIEFRNVSFRYENRNEDALRGISLSLKSNETVAIVGDNGAGKTTLIKLLLRLYKVCDGDILLDGKSIYDYRYEEYLALFAPVFQDFNLYSFTVGENIYFGNEMESLELNKILDKVGLLKKISGLSAGVNTPYTKKFDENGIVFSGGEEQKLIIARAFAKRSSSSMILDEPTAALDPLSEYEINQLIHNASPENFTIFISHRLSTTRFADKIIVLDNGAVIEQGNHDELMAQANGLYRNIYDMQSSYYKDRGESNLLYET